MIIGETEVVSKLSMDKEKLWQETQMHAGITKNFYNQYFEFQDCACAYGISGVKRYGVPVTLKDIGIEYTPQSFIYVGEMELC